ncbi:MFS transporter [Anoxynatronum buryatiense]|uniref:Sugar phosphate permease n=1 Tax=Anoxynatronum buryatiense TaxID=489973 RepID=A0AA45WST6_9CLOT|nr:MFS transporter [Anoxynatronum buryatiense]SMP38631.1 Sugar phosphate permease [Anoxynatronum buryatiense]
MKRTYTDNERTKNPLAFSGYSWVIVGISALILFFSGPGQTYNVSVFINSYIESEGWSRSAVSGFYSMATLIAGLLMPLSGRWIDGKGHRLMTPVIATLLAAACIWMSFMKSPWMLMVGFFMIRFLGQGSMSLLSSTLTPQWFVRKRGIALSLTALGGVAGSAMIPVISNRLITNYGPAFAWRFWALLLLGIMVPAGWLLIRNRPEEIGMGPDGMMAYENEQQLSQMPHQQENLPGRVHEAHDWTPGEAMKTRAFWMMLFCMLIPSMINTGITFHMVSIIGEKGFDSSFAALILSIYAMVQLPVTFLAGWLCDHYRVHRLKAFNFGLLAVSMLMVLYSPSRLLLIVYALVHGIYSAIDSVSTGVWWPNYFGRRYLGSIRGMGMTAMVIGSALGPLPFGIAFDTFGNYQFIILVMLIFPLAGFLAALISPPPVLNHISGQEE